MYLSTTNLSLFLPLSLLFSFFYFFALSHKVSIFSSSSFSTSLYSLYFSVLYFALVSIFNGISTFVDYSIPKPSLQKNSSGTI